MTPTLGIPPRHALFRVFLIGDPARALSIDIGGLSPISNLVAWRRGVLESTCSYATLFHLGVRGRNRTLHRGCAADFAEGARPVCRHGTCGSGGGSSAGPATGSAQAPGVCAGAAERGRVGAPGRAGRAAEDRYPAHDGASCDGFGRVGDHLGGRADLAYGDPFSGFARHASGVRRLLGRRGQGLGARRQPGGRPVHRARPVRRRTFLERRGILRVGHRGVPTRTRCPKELQPPFTIRAISHQARTAAETAAAAAKDPADFCELDANCYPDWKGSVSSVAQISFMDNGDELLCSGSLLATRDNSFKPYFLTAGHCINNEAAARTVEAYWTYQTPACGGTPPASRTTSVKSTVGGHLIASAGMADGDFSLVLLQDAPAGATFAGWDIADPPMSTALTGIHHPSGSWKRISFGERTGDATNNVQGVDAPGNLFLQVKWDSGRVEHGSSGSPLFSAPGVIVGSLSYAEFLERRHGLHDQSQCVGVLALFGDLRTGQGLSGESAGRPGDACEGGDRLRDCQPRRSGGAEHSTGDAVHRAGDLQGSRRRFRGSSCRASRAASRPRHRRR